MANQLTIIKALREQQSIKKPHQEVNEEVEKIAAENKPDNDLRIHNTPKQYASNEYAGTKSDADKKEKAKIDYSKYGNGFTKGFIDELVSDVEFNSIINEYLAPNEGGYNNDKDDSGGETNMGISKNTHKNEDIKGNGNAFNILGICTSEMRKHKLPKSEIDAFFKEATSGNYDDLLCTVMKWFNVE